MQLNYHASLNVTAPRCLIWMLSHKHWGCRLPRMSAPPVSYKRHRFPRELIAHAVWLYFRFPLSFRLIEEMLLERGIVVSYETIRR